MPHWIFPCNTITFAENISDVNEFTIRGMAMSFVLGSLARWSPKPNYFDS